MKAEEGKKSEKEDLDIEAQTVRGIDDDEKKGDAIEDAIEQDDTTEDLQTDGNENITTHERRDTNNRV